MPSASYLMLRGCERIVFPWAFSPRTWIRGEGRDPSFDPTRTFHVSVEPPAGAADPPCDETRNSARDTSSLRAHGSGRRPARGQAPRSNLAPVALSRSRLLRRSAPRNDGTMFLPSDDLCILSRRRACRHAGPTSPGRFRGNTVPRRDGAGPANRTAPWRHRYPWLPDGSGPADRGGRTAISSSGKQHHR